MHNDREDQIIKKMAIWGSFYRSNPSKFVRDYLHITLKLFQKILITMMNYSDKFCFIAARGIGKTFLVAVFCCMRSILYPGTKICIASGTRGQSINVLEKIKTELIPRSPELENEIKSISITNTDASVLFKNGSFIKVVTANDGARGNRANILILDEFRMIDEDTLNTVLHHFLTNPRNPGYLSKPEFSHLKEPNKELYLSSAYFKSHWSFQKVRDYFKNMFNGNGKYFVCGIPYQLTLREGLRRREDIEDDMSESSFNEIKWSMEAEALFFGDDGGSFFNFEYIQKNRTIKYPMLPDEMILKLSDKKLKIQPKQNGEIRILSVDIAVMSSRKNKNDATAIFINQCIPQKNNRFVNNIIYTETFEGAHTSDQALRIRKLYEDYGCNYIVIDVKGVGFGVADMLVRDIVDPNTGIIYSALSCKNNSEWAARCSTPNADKSIWVINGSAKFNSDCAILLREGLKSGKIRLLQNEYDAELLLNTVKGYSNMTPKEKINCQLPFINTTLLVNELINLDWEESNGLIKVHEKPGMRKDRYSSLSYNYYVACQLENAMGKKRDGANSDMAFLFRAPKIR